MILRFCEARVWSFYGSLMGEQWANQYLDYAQGSNLTNRMPLFVTPPSGIIHSLNVHIDNH